MWSTTYCSAAPRRIVAVTRRPDANWPISTGRRCAPGDFDDACLARCGLRGHRPAAARQHRPDRCKRIGAAQQTARSMPPSRPASAMCSTPASRAPTRTPQHLIAERTFLDRGAAVPVRAVDWTALRDNIYADYARCGDAERAIAEGKLFMPPATDAGPSSSGTTSRQRRRARCSRPRARTVIDVSGPEALTLRRTSPRSSRRMCRQAGRGSGISARRGAGRRHVTDGLPPALAERHCRLRRGTAEVRWPSSATPCSASPAASRTRCRLPGQTYRSGGVMREPERGLGATGSANRSEMSDPNGDTGRSGATP